MTHKHSFEKVQEWIDKNVEDIYLDGLGKLSLNLEDSIVKVIKSGAHRTTLSLKDKKRICQSELRSIGDIYKLLQYHYKPVSLEKVFNAIINLIRKYKLCTWYCCDISKRVYYTHDSKGYLHGISDEYGFDYTQFKLPKGSSISYGYHDEKTYSTLL